jgi:hypothetical protein
LPLWPARLVYLQSQEGFPSPSLWCSGCPTLFPLCLYCSCCLLVSFSFFPRWRSVCPGGYAALAQACLWEYHGTAKLTWCASSQAMWVWVTFFVFLALGFEHRPHACKAGAFPIKATPPALFPLVLHFIPRSCLVP